MTIYTESDMYGVAITTEIGVNETQRISQATLRRNHMQRQRMMKRYARYKEWSKDKTGGGWNDEQNRVDRKVGEQ